MAEPLAAFVNRRRSDWEELERLLAELRQGTLSLSTLRRLDLLYRRASADLARAQAYYPGTDAERFLNQLAGSCYRQIYKPAPRGRLASTWEFFRVGFPRAVREELGYVGASALLLILGGLWGALAVWLEPRAAILVPEGIRQSIAANRLWTDGLLSVMPPGVAASSILTNNLSVAISAFGLGASAGLGTALLLLSNGLHLGSVLALCFQHDLGHPLLGFIAAHGPVELSIIALAGASGLMIGHTLIEPGELPRKVALRQRAAKAVRLLLGGAPFLALIGVVEGYVSPGDLFSAPLKAALGALLFAAFWGYLALAGRASEPRALLPRPDAPRTTPAAGAAPGA